MSNKQPKKPEEKTASERSTRTRGSLVHLIFGAIMLFLGGWLLWSGVSNVADNKQLLVAPNGRIQIEVADTTEARYQGLSGRSDTDGLLFVYDQSSQEHCLVMRDMLFSIDMVWMDEDKKVITVASNVSPETYPEVFCPDKPARYALELESGRAEELGIKTGERLVY